MQKALGVVSGIRPNFKPRLKAGVIKLAAAAIALAFALAAPLNGAEFKGYYSEAQALYEAGSYKEASKKADLILKSFQSDVAALIIKGKSEFYQEHYDKAGECFAAACKKAPNHPVVSQYVKLLREINYKMGLGDVVCPQKPLKRTEITQFEFFKKGYFGTGGTFLSGRAVSRSKIAPTALKTPYPKQESVLSEPIAAYFANKALSEGDYNKAYLLFGQLAAVNPSSAVYKLCRAEAAFYIKRYKAVIKLLSPALDDINSAGFTAEQKEKAENLLSNARKALYAY